MRPISLVPVVFFILVFGCDSENGSEGPKQAIHPGKEIYTRYCFSCHQGGVAGSPVYGDKEAWELRLAKGRDALYRSTIDGIPPGMPVKGLCLRCTEDELRDAVDYMILSVTESDNG